jgi:pimeloyl-ACP methyl ester carboxylesterase
MVDMPPEWLANAKASPAWPAIAAGVVSLRADGQALTWAERALADGSLVDIDVPVLAVYGAETFPGMPEAAAAIAAAVPMGTASAVPGAQHRWEPDSMAVVLADFAARTALDTADPPNEGGRPQPD